MSNSVIIKKKIKKFNNTISVTGDKSISIRWILFSSLASGVSKAQNLLMSEDVLASINAIKKLGIKVNFKKKVAFLFGSEASGLSNNEISYANYTLQIPSNPNFSSLNLSHSLIIIAQQVSSLLNFKKNSFKRSNKIKSASKKDIHSMLRVCLKNLEEIKFFKQKEKKPIMLENLRNIFYKMDLSDKETRILSSVFASLGKKR